MTRRVARYLAATGSLVVAACSAASSPAPQNDVSAPSGPLVASVSSIALGSGVPSATFTVSEPGYVGTFTASITCSPGSGVASISPSTVVAPTAVSPVAFDVVEGNVPGTCAITIRDVLAHTVAITVAATPRTPIVAAPTGLTLKAGGLPASFTVTEAGYGGSFFATGCPAGVVLVAPSDATPASPGSPVAFEVVPQAAGTCTITVADSTGSVADVGVTVMP